MTPRTRTAPAPRTWPELPEQLAGWRWAAHTSTAEIHLTSPTGDWSTKWYFKADRAIAEALRRVGSAPQQPAITPMIEALASEIAHDQVVTDAHDRADLLRRSSPEPLPLMQIFVALTEHAEALPRPLPVDLPIVIPPALPDRLPVPRSLIVPGRYQPRTIFDEAKLAELAESIQEHGIINPLIVFANERGQLELVAGERRLRASDRLGLEFVPVEIRSYTLRQIAEISAIDNLQREDLTPLEEGACYEKLIADLKVSESELARRIGRNRSYVQQRRYIAAADPTIHEAITAGRISFTQARSLILAAPGNHDLQKKALKELDVQLKQNKRPTEQEVKALADATVLKTALKTLEDLGWQSKNLYGSGTALYSDGERPRVWSGAEILEAVAQQRRPAGSPPEVIALTEEQRTALEAVRDGFEALGPWYAVRRDYSGRHTFLNSAELIERAEVVSTQLAELVARYAAQGWRLEIKRHSIAAVHPDGAYRSLWGIESIEKQLAEIVAGSVPTVSARAMAPASPCKRCGTERNDLVWVGNERVCPDCAATIRADMLARDQALGRQVALLLAPLNTLPADVLRMLGCDQQSDLPADTAEALSVITRRVASTVRRRDDLVALLPPDPGAPAGAPASPAVGTLAWIIQQLEEIERQIDGGLTGELTGAELETLGEELEDLADVLDDATYHDLAGRIERAFEALPEESEAAA